MRVAIDFEAEGLLDGADDREARLELLRTLESEGFTLDELREAAAHDRLALLPVERVLAGEGKLYTKEELAEKTGLDAGVPRRGGARARRAGARARRARDHRGGARAVTQRQGRCSTPASRRRRSSSSPP